MRAAMLSTVRAAVLAVAALAGSGIVAQAAGRAALVVDGNTGQDLHASDADKPLYPASLTKMMTLYIVFDLMEQKRISNATRIQVTARCAGQPPSNLDVEAGSSLPLRDAVLALIVKSANDVACAVGENLAGSEDQFAQLMTSRARQLGMRATTFRNASGLPDPAQVTTARDMVTLALRLAHDFPEHYKLFATREFTFNGHTHRSHNSLLHGFEGTDGIKTGYTRASGFNLVSSVRRGQKHVIGVVMGGVTAAQRNATMRAILTQGLGRARAMARPVLVWRPALVADAAGVPVRTPVPRRVASAAAPAEETAPDHRPADEARINRRGAVASQPVPTPQAKPAIDWTRATTLAAPPRTVSLAAAGPGGQGRPPATLQAQAAGAPANSVQVAAAPPTGTGTGRPAGLGGQPVPRRSTVSAAPVPAVTGLAAAMGFHVQIGAFSSAAEAQRHLQSVSLRSGAALAGHPPLTMASSKADVRFFRARYAGFNEVQAQAACQSLRQQKIECVVVRAE